MAQFFSLDQVDFVEQQHRTGQCRLVISVLRVGNEDRFMKPVNTSF